MPCATITITDHTATAVDLFRLLGKGSATGYTVSPSTGLAPTTFIGCVAYLSIQSDPKNASAKVFKGDENTANDGTRQGKTMLAGDVDVAQSNPYTTHLGEIYLRTDTDNTVINVEVHYA